MFPLYGLTIFVVSITSRNEVKGSLEDLFVGSRVHLLIRCHHQFSQEVIKKTRSVVFRTAVRLPDCLHSSGWGPVWPDV
jgi:hypothetical protein